MKTNSMRLVNVVLLSIILIFWIGACVPAAPASPLSAVESCDVNEIKLTNIHWFQEPDGAWRVVGVMHNDSNQTISKVFMEVLTRDKNNKSVFPNGPEGEDISAYPPNLVPGGQAPFSVWIKREIPGLDHFTIDTKLCVTAEPVKRLQLQEHGGQLIVKDGMAQVTLEVVNPGSETALINGTMIGVLDASNKLISAIDADVTPRILAPGESGPIRATLALPSGSAAKIKSYKLYQDALVTTPASKLLDVQKDLKVDSQYVDADGHFHLIGQIANSGTKPLMVSVQATVYLDSAKSFVVDASSFDTLIPVAPGTVLPFDLTDWRVLNNKTDLRNLLSRRNTAITLRVEPFRTWIASISVAPLTVIEQPPAFSRQAVVFTGQVRNDTGHNIVLGTVTAVLRDSRSGKIIATGQTSLNDANAFAVGEVQNYSIAIPTESGFDPQSVQSEVSASGQT